MTSPLLTALIAAAAAGASALAALPYLGRDRLPAAWIGWANALAAGLMLGVAYVLLLAGRAGPQAPLAVAAALGIGFVLVTQRLFGAPPVPAADAASDPGYRLLLGSSLHAAHEGIAIGAALATDWRFGLFTAGAMALHNIPESAELVGDLRRRGARLGEAAALAVVADAHQVLGAVVTLALISAHPALAPWAIGFAVGSLIHLTLIEPLPASYRAAGRTSIALVTIAAMGTVALLRSLVP